MTHIRKQRRNSPEARARRGIALLELAILLPLLVVITFGCVDFGRFVYAYVAVTNAAEEGATFGCLNSPLRTYPQGSWTAAVQAAAVAEPNGLTPAITSSNVTVTPPGTSSPGGVKVSVVYSFSMLVPGAFSQFGLPSTVPIRRTVVMPTP